MSLLTPAQLIAQGTAKIRTATTVSITTKAGHDYDAGKGIARQRESYAPDGSVLHNDFSLLLVKSELDANSDTPAAQDTITVAGTVYRINEIKDDPFGAHYHLLIGAAYS